MNKNLYTARAEYSFAPGRRLDTNVFVAPDGSIDLTLTDSALEQIATDATAAREQWDVLYRDTSLSEQERLVARRHIAEITLASCVAEQMLYEEDVSNEIAELQEELYGYYDPELFRAALGLKRTQLAELTLPPEWQIQRGNIVAKLDAWGADVSGDILAQPTHATLEMIGGWLQDNFGDVLDEIENDGHGAQYDAQLIVDYFQKLIDSTPALYESGWHARVVDRKKSSVTTRATDKEIVVSSQRRASQETLQGLMIHEGGHALRSVLAEANGDELGQYGTAAYARFEEALMIAFEQCLKGAHTPTRGLEHYLAAGLANTENVPKDEIFKLFFQMSLLKNIAEQREEPEKKAGATAVAFLRRDFAGMVDVDEGISHRKDIDYFYGLNESWRFLNYISAHDIVDESLNWVMSAKFNPFVAGEREHVARYTPMPQKLKNLFE